MNALLITALLLSGADSLTATKVAGLALKAPAGWTVSDATDGKSWEAPGNEAQMELTVFAVDPKRPAQECLDQLLEKIGKDGWDKLDIGKSLRSAKSRPTMSARPTRERPKPTRSRRSCTSAATARRSGC